MDERGHNHDSFYSAPRVTNIVKTTSHEVIEISDSEDEQPARPKEEELSTTFIAWTKGRKKEKERGIENSEMGGNEQISSVFPFESTLSRSNHWPSETVQILMVSALPVSRIQALVLTFWEVLPPFVITIAQKFKIHHS